MDETVQRNLLLITIVATITSTLSAIGSILILIALLRTRPKSKRWSTPYYRFMFTISFYDLLLSIAFALGRIPMPIETGMSGAKGTWVTCNIQVFFRHLGYTSFAYSAALIIYYVLVVKYNYKDDWIAKRYEPIVHIICTGFFLLTAIIGLVLKVYNPGMYIQKELEKKKNRKKKECVFSLMAVFESLLFFCWVFDY